MPGKRHQAILYQTAYSPDKRQGRTGHQDHTGHVAEKDQICLTGTSQAGTHQIRELLQYSQAA